MPGLLTGCGKMSLPKMTSCYNHNRTNSSLAINVNLYIQKEVFILLAQKAKEHSVTESVDHEIEINM